MNEIMLKAFARSVGGLSSCLVMYQLILSHECMLFDMVFTIHARLIMSHLKRPLESLDL